MSVLFPKVNKPPQWNWRPIYYDPKKEEMERKLRQLQAERAASEKEAANSNSADANAEKASEKPYTPTLHHGSFREAHQENAPINQRAQHQSRMAFWVALLGMLLLMWWLLS